MFSNIFPIPSRAADIPKIKSITLRYIRSYTSLGKYSWPLIGKVNHGWQTKKYLQLSTPPVQLLVLVKILNWKYRTGLKLCTDRDSYFRAIAQLKVIRIIGLRRKFSFTKTCTKIGLYEYSHEQSYMNMWSIQVLIYSYYLIEHAAISVSC